MIISNIKKKPVSFEISRIVHKAMQYMRSEFLKIFLIFLFIMSFELIPYAQEWSAVTVK